jgi:uncharacterized repeat protein (TIGR03803 family)
MTIMITLRASADGRTSQNQTTTRHRGDRAFVIAILLTFLLSALTARRAQAQTLSVLHVFAGQPGDGANPQSNLTVDSSGNLYGTTENGGSADAGTVFELDTSGVLTLLYSFAGSPDDGAFPVAGIVRDSSGNLYGTTRGGGPSGNGIVFKLDTSGSLTILHEFAGSPEDGAHPYAGLVLDPSSNFLYGTTKDGGSNNLGTVFKLDTSGNNYSMLHNFAGYSDDGSHPHAGLVLDPSSNFLYGTTYDGGSNNLGTVFKVDTAGNNFGVLHSFVGFPGDGAYPYADLILDASSNLYGTTGSGGSSNGGTAFKMATSGNNFVLLHSFAMSDGVTPEAGLVLDTANNLLYGTTSLAGVSTGGTVFDLDTAGGNFAVLHNFGVSPDDPVNPYSALAMDSSSNLYGTTYDGGSNGFGTVFEISMARKSTIQDIINQINSLSAQGVLNKGQANSLIVKLEHASERQDAGNTTPAIEVLESFINEVNALLNSGRLTSEQGSGLINAANGVIEQLQAM